MAYASITKPGLHFNTKLYTGTGSSNAITGVGFQPDFTWIKSRNNGSNNNHMLFDAVRGATKYVKSDQNSAENTLAETLKSFDSDGFTVGTQGDVNTNSINFVSWNWKASNSTGSTNNDGSIATTVSVNTTAGFSIVKWTGTGSSGTLGHGLGAIPNAIWVKKTSQADDWFNWHTALGAQGKINFNNTSAVQNDTGYWNNTTPTNQVFSVTSNGANNASGQTYIAYCFTSKKGYSKFGSYKGNGNSSGSFIYTGFKPGWVLWKRTDTTAGWYLLDTVREPTNGNGRYLLPAESDAEQNDSSKADLLSNGFKLRNTDGSKNASGGTYVYHAFAENPLVANVGESIPATAR
jgi:hypothetical protein|tara:strand:+ start:22 stop:1068 length:1047 start_codon:yes stop_codon:yes gene_type:complete